MNSRMGSPWHISSHAREPKFGTLVNNHISWWSKMSRMTQSSKTPVRSHQHPPSMTSSMGDSQHTSNYAKKLKFGTRVKNHIWWWYMMLSMAPSSKTPVRNLQCPPGKTSRTGGSWHTSHARGLKFCKLCAAESYKKVVVDGRIDGWLLFLSLKIDQSWSISILSNLTQTDIYPSVLKLRNGNI